ncbi:MAG: 4-alpha-glucanotransferase [Actinobacteria bacterium]|nr:4-alpha-glucanotransferase [Actinomycetota bacterium]
MTSSGELPSEALQSLARAHGVATDFWDFGGNHRIVTAATIRSVLRALGVAADTDDDVARSLEDADLAPWRHVLPPCVVMRGGADHVVAVHVTDGARVEVEVVREDGERIPLDQAMIWVEPREIDGRRIGRASFTIPGRLPLGWHTLIAREEGRDAVEAPLAVTPDRLPTPQLARGRGWGMMAQLYSIRSESSWGMGDTRDLAELASFFGDVGADFLLINPLHATSPTLPMTPSPYLPATRRFVNPIYIRPEDIPEVGYLSGPQRSLVEWAAEDVRPANHSNAPIDRDAVWEAKSQALEVIHAAGRSRARQRDFERFCADGGSGLQDFALWCALREKYQHEPFPPELASSNSPFVARQRRELADRIDYHCWLQWIVDEQLESAQRAAVESGMGIGIMHDLAVGVHPVNADSWSTPEVFAAGIGVGAPPDMYNQQGQNWHQPPWRPDALARSAYAPLRDMARSVLRHAGALRIDHIIGLFRLWWIPEGAGAAEGTYVRYDHEAMVGVLLLEAHRANAVIIGEDLGTVEPWVREYLASRGVFGTSVLWFEKDQAGYPIPAESFRELVLATVDTHDLPPAAGYLAGEHVDIRARLGLLTEPEPKVRAEANQERDRMVGRMYDYGLLDEDPTEREIIEALHRYVAMTPSLLVGVSLTDAVGERRAQNQPGTDTEYPNWMIPLADGSETPVMVEKLPSNARLLSLVAALRAQLGEADRLS